MNKEEAIKVCLKEVEEHLIRNMLPQYSDYSIIDKYSDKIKFMCYDNLNRCNNHPTFTFNFWQ